MNKHGVDDKNTIAHLPYRDRFCEVHADRSRPESSMTDVASTACPAVPRSLAANESSKPKVIGVKAL